MRSAAIISVSYSFDIDNGLSLYYKDIEIGKNIPKSLYQSFIPYEENELIYNYKIKGLDLIF